MLLVVMLLGMATALLVYGMVDTTSIALRRDKDVAAAFAQAKQALIGRAVADDTRPGSLPCPDTDDDGSAELFGAGSECPSYIGRLPWRTLGLPDLRDSDGERLWYALSNNFRDHVNAEPINSDTKGNRTVNSESIAVIITTEAVAVIFAPGAIVGSQVRETANSAACAAPPATIATTLCAANYLEATGGANNATAGGAYVTAMRSDTFNDRLLVITTADLMPVVEQRVARELLALLERYRTAPGKSCPNNCYTAADEDFTNEEDQNAFRGWLPLCEADPDNWGALGITLPAWLTNNDWWKVIYYAVAPDKTENNSGGTLTVDGAPAHVVLITPGPAPEGVTRPNPPIVRTPTTPTQCVVEGPISLLAAKQYWQQYLSPNDPLNYDHSDNTYATPSSTAYARNRLYVIRP